MTEVVVTGASGQIGSAVLRARPAQAVITAISRRPAPGAARHLAIDLSALLAAPPTDLQLPGATVAVLLASRITMSTDVAELAAQLQLELRATLDLLERMPDLQHVVYASSCTVYGMPTRLPITEATSPHPANIYAVAKVATEDMLRILGARRGIPIAILRIAQVFGPGSPDAEIIARFCRMAAQGQAPSVTCGDAAYRDYVDEDDVASAIWAAIARRSDGTFNLGGGMPTTIASLARTSCTLAGLAIEPAITATATTYSMLLDITRAREAFGYLPQRTPADEMRRRLEPAR